MAWYSKYLAAFERHYQDVSNEIKKEIADKMLRFRQDDTTPVCSVVAIAHNEEKHILGCLWSLVDNICDFPVEIIVVSNNSTDAKEQLLNEVGVLWYSEEKKGPGFARQCGLNHARGKYHICIDSDTLYPPYYVATHVKHLDKGSIVCTYGLWSFLPDAHHSKSGLFFYELLRDFYLSLQNINRPELCVRGMVLAFRTDIGRKIGYNTSILRGEDGMMALGLKQYGKLKFLKSRKARAITCNGTLDGGGNLARNAWSRFKKGIRNIKKQITTQSKYDDRDYNVIKKDER